MSFPRVQGRYRAESKSADLLRSAGLVDAMSVFDHPDIKVWRSIRERENCVLDHETGRLHIKRNKPGYQGVEAEAEGIRLLKQAGISTVPLAACGRLHDGRGFLISEDLADHDDSEKLVAGGLAFDRLLEPTARMAAQLHGAGLHHRDLYLCHFYANTDEDSVDLVLMDAGRVRKLPWLFKRRWIVKDLAQFIYSTMALKVTNAQRDQWLKAYAEARKIPMNFRSAIDHKVASIARHDAALKRDQPNRNVSIPR